MTGRYLVTEPYNNLTLTCSVAITVRNAPAPLNILFSWQRALGDDPFLDLPSDLYSNDRVFGDTASSTLTVSTTQAGSHTYSCGVILDVAPATDVLTGNDSVTLEVIGQCEHQS